MAKRGLGSDNMSDSKKREIQSMGGRASGAARSNSQRATSTGRGSNLTQADRTKGGKNSHRNT